MSKQADWTLGPGSVEARRCGLMPYLPYFCVLCRICQHGARRPLALSRWYRRCDHRSHPAPAELALERSVLLTMNRPQPLEGRRRLEDRQDRQDWQDRCVRRGSMMAGDPAAPSAADYRQMDVGSG